MIGSLESLLQVLACSVARGYTGTAVHHWAPAYWLAAVEIASCLFWKMTVYTIFSQGQKSTSERNLWAYNTCTQLHLRIKFQIWEFCSFWATAGENQCYHPASQLAHLMLREPELVLRKNSQAGWVVCAMQCYQHQAPTHSSANRIHLFNTSNVNGRHWGPKRKLRAGHRALSLKLTFYLSSSSVTWVTLIEWNRFNATSLNAYPVWEKKCFESGYTWTKTTSLWSYHVLQNCF